MKCKSNPHHPLYYKSCSLKIFVSMKAIQDKITLEIMSINKNNVRVNHKHQITPKTSLTVIFGGFMHHLEPCWNKMFSLRASLLSAPGVGCPGSVFHVLLYTKPPSRNHIATGYEHSIFYYCPQVYKNGWAC